jgi:hypothetical protein
VKSTGKPRGLRQWHPKHYSTTDVKLVLRGLLQLLLHPHPLELFEPAVKAEGDLLSKD